MTMSDKHAHNLTWRLFRGLEGLAEPHHEQHHDLGELYNYFASVIPVRGFKDRWTPEHWQAITDFDAFWKSATAKYNKLPPWHRFWASQAGQAIAIKAGELRDLLKKTDGELRPPA